ncbi:helix-turn-helix domain-containing protein [Austwickia sp. TVS 96-490-7B]|uniref:winged helix-turn-helix domain-containing protein n=1 Tax=Austwickia sp. TVS 96-490-7B TaxID=2830843 RepID=UPI001C56760D|nr:helix-turn-helix domain-containing protein [Austwickia sp. TVS 96-490-7B]
MTVDPPHPPPGDSGAYPVDRAALRLLAHPWRSRLLAELRTLGPGTAADLARRLDTNTGVTSYHLRRLAEIGLIEDSGTGRGRERVWVASSHQHTVDFDDADDSDEAAAEWLARDYVQHLAERTQAWISDASEWPPHWQDAAGLDDRLVLVTDEQLAALRTQIDDLLEKYRRVGAGNPQAKRVVFYTCALPVDAPPHFGRGSTPA